MMESGMGAVREAIARYAALYRNPALPELEVSGLYVLFPDENATPSEKVESHWPQTWPLGDRNGVYFMLDSDGSLLYLGKASMGRGRTDGPRAV